MNPTRKAVLAIALLSATACVTPARLAMQPRQAAGQEVRWNGATPVLRSTGKAASVAVAPSGDAAGRHEMSSRASFLIVVRNETDGPLSLGGSGVAASVNGRTAYVFPSKDLEKDIRSDPATPRTASAVSAVLASWEPAAGSGASGPFPVGPDALAGPYPQTTIPPRQAAGGFVVVDVARETACAQNTPQGIWSGACAYTLVVTVANEVHSFSFAESK
jgi:hypothetical protein